MIKKFEDFIDEKKILAIFDEYFSLNESRKEAKRVAEIAKKEVENWGKKTKSAYNNVMNAMKNKELMTADCDEYLKELDKKMDEFSKSFDVSDESKFEYSFIIYLISFIKSFQTNLFKNGIEIVKQTIKSNKDTLSFRKYGLDDKTIYDIFQENQDFLQKSLQKSVEDTSKYIENACETINEHLEKIEKDSDMHPIVFGDSKIKNKERHRIAPKFKTVYHSDIADFVKDYKLVGIEYDKRIKFVDKQEIFNRFFNKIVKTIEENAK